MKPATYKETVIIIRAFVTGDLKQFLSGKTITYQCAMMRISRFRRAEPKEYAKLVKR